MFLNLCFKGRPSFSQNKSLSIFKDYFLEECILISKKSGKGCKKPVYMKRKNRHYSSASRKYTGGGSRVRLLGINIERLSE